MRTRARKCAESFGADGGNRNLDLRFTKPLSVYTGTRCKRKQQNVTPGPTGKTKSPAVTATRINRAARSLVAAIDRGELKSIEDLRAYLDRALASKLSRSQRRRVATLLAGAR